MTTTTHPAPAFPLNASVRLRVTGAESGVIVGYEWGPDRRHPVAEWVYHVRTGDGNWLLFGEGVLREWNQ